MEQYLAQNIFISVKFGRYHGDIFVSSNIQYKISPFWLNVGEHTSTTGERSRRSTCRVASVAKTEGQLWQWSNVDHRTAKGGKENSITSAFIGVKNKNMKRQRAKVDARDPISFTLNSCQWSINSPGGIT